MQPGLDARRVQLVDHRLEARPAVGIGLRVGPAVAEAERAAAVEVDLVDAQVCAQFDPVVDLLLGHVAEVEQVRAAVDRPRPAPTARRCGECGRSGAAVTASCSTLRSFSCGQPISATFAPAKPNRG